MGTLLATPAARYVAHVVIAGLAVFVPLWAAAGYPIEKSAVLAVVGAAARALLGATTSVNPRIGANVV